MKKIIGALILMTSFSAMAADITIVEQSLNPAKYNEKTNNSLFNKNGDYTISTIIKNNTDNNLSHIDFHVQFKYKEMVIMEETRRQIADIPPNQSRVVRVQMAVEKWQLPEGSIQYSISATPFFD